MEFFNLFTQQQINDVLKRTFSYPDEKEVSFSVDKVNGNENFMVLNLKDNDNEEKFVLVKIPTDVQLVPQGNNDLKVFYPVFVIKNDNDFYGAYKWQDEFKHYGLPKHNNIECLKTILENLVECQITNLIKREEKIEKFNWSQFKDITEAVTGLHVFKDLDDTEVKQSIKNIQLAVNKLLKNSAFLVKSIWSPFKNNVCVSKDIRESIFFTVPSNQTVPLAYDALLYIFGLTDEKFRLKHFEDLMFYYFELLRKLLRRAHGGVADEITTSCSEHQVKVLLPMAKFVIVGSFLKSEDSRAQEILKNISYFLKYPLINQEDIFETVKNKIESSDFDLIDYSLVPLSEKNGHLGEYYHLDIKIKTQEEEQTLQLFAKFLITATEVMEKILKDGPARKEHFFYRTLLPLYTKHGLGDLLDFAPKCYLSRIDWLLILDDLIRQGYVGFKPNSVFSYAGLRAMVEKFAKLHSCTLILEERLSEKSGKTVRLDEDYEEIFKDNMLVYDETSPLKEMFDSTLEMLYYIVGKFPEVTKKLNMSQEEIKIPLKKLFLSVFSRVQKSASIRNVINHGDVFTANMLLKHFEDELMTKGILVDFQMLRYVSPNYDLLVFLFHNSTKDTRDRYFKILIAQYYQCITENLTKFNYDPEVVFPRKVFDENVKFMMPAGVMGAFMYAHILQIDPDFREEIAHDEEKFDYYFNKHKNELVDISWKIEHYRNILEGLVKDIVDVIKNDF